MWMAWTEDHAKNGVQSRLLSPEELRAARAKLALDMLTLIQHDLEPDVSRQTVRAVRVAQRWVAVLLEVVAQETAP
jgi:hypothetical protein